MSATLLISYRHQYGLLRPREGGRSALSTRVISVSENIRHLQMRGDRRLFLLTAARDEVYDDGHHELTDVSLTLFAPTGTERARITARRAVYYQQSGLVIFATDVVASAPEGLRLHTDLLHYDQTAEIVRTERAVTFAHARLEGTSEGAELHLRHEGGPLILARAVRFTIRPDGGFSRGASRLTPNSETPWTVRAQTARFRLADRTFQLRGDVLIARDEEQVRADQVEGALDEENRIQWLKASGRVLLRSDTGRIRREITAGELVLSFVTSANGRLAGRRILERATASDGVVVSIWHDERMHTMQSPRLEVTFSAHAAHPPLPQTARTAGGRATVRWDLLHAPSPRAEKRLEADVVDVTFHPGTSAVQRISASGQVHIEMREAPDRGPQPINGSAGASSRGEDAAGSSIPSRATERRTIRAERAHVEFDPTHGGATVAWAEGRVRVEIESRGTTSARGPIVTTSARLQVAFDARTREATEFTQIGDVRFHQGDRRARSDRAVYEVPTGWLRLRGGDPTIDDAQGRTRAEEVDVNLREEKLIARGRVLTTRSSREAASSGLPFFAREAPIFIAAERLEADGRTSWARYRGRVRAWQQDSFLAAEEMEIRPSDRTLRAHGGVRSLLVTMRRPEGESRTSQRIEDAPETSSAPVFISADLLTYTDSARTFVYEGDVTLHRGTQRLMARRLTIVLRSETAQIAQAIAEGDVRLVEPERHASATRALYTEHEIVLEGHPARVSDARQHLLQEGARLTFSLRGDKVSAEGDDGARRVRIIRKIPRGEP